MIRAWSTDAVYGAEAALREWLGTHAPLLGPVPVEHLWAIRRRLLEADPSLRHRLSELRRRILDLSLRESRGCVAAADITAAYPIPSFDSASRDGYAVAAESVSGATAANPVSLKIVDVVNEGYSSDTPVASGQAVAISAGRSNERLGRLCLFHLVNYVRLRRDDQRVAVHGARILQYAAGAADIIRMIDDMRRTFGVRRDRNAGILRLQL